MMLKFVISTSQSIHLIKWKNVMEEMPVQEPGYGSIDLTDLINNKKLGGKRSIPQEQSELRKETKKEKTMQMCPKCEFVSHNETYFNEHMTTVHAKLRKETEQKRVMRTCPQCDFISQNETYFNEHMTKVHSGQPNCLFCFIAFKNYSTLRNCS